MSYSQRRRAHRGDTIARSSEADVAVANHFFGQRNAFDYDLVETPITLNQASLLFAASPTARGLLPSIDRALSEWKKDADSPCFSALNRTCAAPRNGAWPDWLMPTLAIGIAIVIVLGAGLLLLRRPKRSSNAARIADPVVAGDGVGLKCRSSPRSRRAPR